MGHAQDVDGGATFHKADVVALWPGQPPTRGMDNHRAGALTFFKTFPDQHLDNSPYKALFASGDWTCPIAHFTGTMNAPMQGPSGKQIPATGQVVRRGLLHHRSLARRPDHAGAHLLRHRHLHEADRPSNVAAAFGPRASVTTRPTTRSLAHAADAAHMIRPKNERCV